jgi:hypothetical protein
MNWTMVAHPPDRERIRLWFSMLCAIPWVVIAGGYLEVCIARLVLSRWPRPMLDDPKELATEPLHLIVWVFILSLGVATPFLIGFAIRNRRKIFNDWRYLVRIGMFATGLFAFWLLIYFDPGRVWYWFLD